MSVTVAEIKHDVEALLGKFEQVDRIALNALDVVMAHPEGAAILQTAAGLCGLNLPPGTITGWGAAGQAILGLFAPSAPTPAAAAVTVAA